MNADPHAQRSLLDLAETDAEAARLQHRTKNLPEDAEVAELQRQSNHERDEAARIATILEDLDRDIAKVERDVSQTRLREQKDRELLASGSVGSKQLTEIEHELRGLERRQALLEDEELEIMERREAVELDQQRAEATVLATQDKLTGAGRRREDAVKDIEAARIRVVATREDLVAALPGDLYAEYERRRATGGAGAGLLQARRCGACRIELDRGFIDSVARTAPEKVVHCDECGAILVRTGHSGLP